MPCLPTSTYRAPFPFRGGHIQTVAPVLLRKVPWVTLRRETLETPDDDFFEVDFAGSGGRDIAILSHGLEGNSRRGYMLGMCRALLDLGLDCALRNFRGCGGRINRRPYFYHSGQTEDLHTLVEHCRKRGYERIFLAGFSMGGNQTLKYLGENPERVPEQVRAAAVFSVPVDLVSCARELDRPANTLYMHYFLRTLRQKVRAKRRQYPELYPLRGLNRIRTFARFDERYTAPVNGFASAEDYWRRASSLPVLPAIRVPALLVNARNDPFLGPPCFPGDIAAASGHLYLESPEHGGHLGFMTAPGKPLWSELRAVEFFRTYL